MPPYRPINPTSELFMSSVGRQRLPYLRAEMKISLPARLCGEVDLVLEDPITKRAKYGARSRLIAGLLQQWLEGIQGKPITPLPSIEALREGTDA